MKYLLFLPFLVILASCQHLSYNQYSLADFDPVLRKKLEKVISYGGTCYDNYYQDEFELAKTTSVANLEKLLQSEHPVLRAFAFSALCKKENYAVDELLLSHLSDTAIISSCLGEFGTQHTYLSDYYLQESQRKTNIKKTFLFDNVIREHPYLSHAADFVSNWQTDGSKYHDNILYILKHPNPIMGREIEESLLAKLAELKRTEDISFIAGKLEHRWKYFPEGGFRIIINEPDTAFFPLLESCYKYITFPRDAVNTQLALTGGYAKLDSKFEYFLEAVSKYKTGRSAEMLENIVNRKLFPLVIYSDESLAYEIYNLLEKNRCPVYLALMKRLEKKHDDYAVKLIPMELSPAERMIGETHDPDCW